MSRTSSEHLRAAAAGSLMRIPYVIDNQSHKMADILNGLLGQSLGESMDEFAIVDALGGVSG